MLLAVLTAAALLGLPWLTTAPNRLMSGVPLWLLPLVHGPWALPAGSIVIAVLALAGLGGLARGRAGLLAMLTLTMALIPGLFWLAGV